MELKSEDVLGFIGGALGIVLLGLFAYWLMWDSDADERVDEVKAMIERQERAWSQAGGDVKISYNDVISSGFPFYTKVRVLMPKIQVTLPEGEVQFSMNYINLQVADEDSGQMQVLYLPDAILSVKPASQAQKDYFLHLSAAPKLMVISSKKADETSLRYDLEYPSHLTLDIERNGKSVKLPWQLGAGGFIQHRPVPQSIHALMRWLVMVAQQSMAR